MNNVTRGIWRGTALFSVASLASRSIEANMVTLSIVTALIYAGAYWGWPPAVFKYEIVLRSVTSEETDRILKSLSKLWNNVSVTVVDSPPREQDDECREAKAKEKP